MDFFKYRIIHTGMYDNKRNSGYIVQILINGSYYINTAFDKFFYCEARKKKFHKIIRLYIAKLRTLCSINIFFKKKLQK